MEATTVAVLMAIFYNFTGHNVGVLPASDAESHSEKRGKAVPSCEQSLMLKLGSFKAKVFYFFRSLQNWVNQKHYKEAAKDE